MSRHGFAAGETVELTPTPADTSVPGGRYTVKRPLPTERGYPPRYHVRCDADGHERVVDEGQLRPGAKFPTWPPTSSDGLSPRPRMPRLQAPEPVPPAGPPPVQTPPGLPPPGPGEAPPRPETPPPQGPPPLH